MQVFLKLCAGVGHLEEERTAIQFNSGRAALDLSSVGSGIHARHDVEAKYLRELLLRHRLSPHEVACRSAIIAAQLGLPELKFSRQAVSSWVNGTRTPRPGHRQILAIIVQVPLEELNRNWERAIELPTIPLLREVSVRVLGKNNETFEYALALGPGIDLSRPAVYRRWADMFSSRPEPLMRHFRNMNYTLFGWINNDAGSPLILHYPCLVPLHTDRLTLETRNAYQRKVWFIYLPDRSLTVGFAYRDKHSLVLVENGQRPARRYPLSNIDLVGYVTGKPLFQIHSVVG